MRLLIFLVAAVAKVGGITGSMAIRLLLPGSFGTSPAVHAAGGSRPVLLIGTGVLLFGVLLLASLAVLILVLFHDVRIYADKLPGKTGTKRMPINRFPQLWACRNSLPPSASAYSHDIDQSCRQVHTN